LFCARRDRFSLTVGASPAYAATHIAATTYSTNTTWTLENSPYVIDGDVTVAAGVTLTIDPDVIVKFNGSFRTMFVNGMVNAQGTEGHPITFTSYQDDFGGDTNGDGSATQPAPGQWSDFQIRSSGSQFRWVNVRYGGIGSAQNYAPFDIYGSGYSATIDHATITNNQRTAVYVGSNATVTVTNSTLSSNQYGIYINQGTAIVDGTTIAANSGRGVWFNLPTFTPLPAASRITNSEISGNGSQGVYIGANGDYPLASMPVGTQNNIYGNNNAGVQLEVSGYPGFVRADVNWRDNFWGENVYYWEGNPLCTGTSPYSPGHLAYRSSMGNVPAGPIDSGTYYVASDPWTIYWCGWDRFKIDSCQFSSTYVTGDLREIEFAQPKSVSNAFGCAQQAGLSATQLESDFSATCSDLWTGYVVGPDETSSAVIAEYEPMTRSLFDEFNSFTDVSCPYPGNALVARMQVRSGDSASPPTITYPLDCEVPDSAWWPSSGRIMTGPSWVEPYASRNQRYIYQTFTWNTSRIAAIQACANNQYYKNLTYEPDAVFNNLDGQSYFGRKMSFASNLPRRYDDTRFDDNPDTPTYTVGSGDATQLVADRLYFTLMRTNPGNAVSDTGSLNAQIGKRRPRFCYSTWCIYAQATEPLVGEWGVSVPGTRFWSH
jgi:Right handed beta helix region